VRRIPQPLPLAQVRQLRVRKPGAPASAAAAAPAAAGPLGPAQAAAVAAADTFFIATCYCAEGRAPRCLPARAHARLVIINTALTGQPGWSALKVGARLCSALRDGCARRLLETSTTSCTVASRGEAEQVPRVHARGHAVNRQTDRAGAARRRGQGGWLRHVAPRRPARLRAGVARRRHAALGGLHRQRPLQHARCAAAGAPAPCLPGEPRRPSSAKGPASLARQAASLLRAGRRQHPGERARGPAVHRLCHRRHAQHLRCARPAAALSRPAFVHGACVPAAPPCLLSALASKCPAMCNLPRLRTRQSGIPARYCAIAVMLVKVIHRLWPISLIAEPQHGTLQGVVGAASRAHPAPACVQSMSMRPGLPPARGLTKEVTYDPGPKTCARPGLRRHIPEGPQPAGRVQRGPSLTLSDPAPARGQGAPASTWRTAACRARSAWLRSPWTAGRRRAARCRSPARARSSSRPTTPGARLPPSAHPPAHALARGLQSGSPRLNTSVNWTLDLFLDGLRPCTSPCVWRAVGPGCAGQLLLTFQWSEDVEPWQEQGRTTCCTSVGCAAESASKPSGRRIPCLVSVTDLGLLLLASHTFAAAQLLALRLLRHTA